jgi:hypothetical protein
MKRETARYVTECEMCRRVKADHMRLAGLLQPLSIPAWKWEDIIMDFIVGLPLIGHKFNSIWVIADQLTKFAHFILVHTFYMAEKYVELYVSRIVCLHGVLKTIISDRGPLFITRFWEHLHASLGSHLIHSYHLELLPTMVGVHNVFHISQLKKCLKLLVDVIVDYVAPLDADLSYPEHPVKVLGQQDWVTRCQMIRVFKVRWSCHSEQEATWETEEFLRSKYPEFLPP